MICCLFLHFLLIDAPIFALKKCFLFSSLCVIEFNTFRQMSQRNIKQKKCTLTFKIIFIKFAKLFYCVLFGSNYLINYRNYHITLVATEGKMKWKNEEKIKINENDFFFPLFYIFFFHLLPKKNWKERNKKIFFLLLFSLCFSKSQFSIQNAEKKSLFVVHNRLSKSILIDLIVSAH